MWFEEAHKEDPIRVDYLQQVISIEDVLNLEGDLPISKYLVLQFDDIEKFFVYSKNDHDEEHPDENGKFSIYLPVQVQEVIKLED